MQSIFSSPNPILFGSGSSKLIGEKLSELGCKKVLVVYDLGIKKAGIADNIISIINKAGIETVCFDEVVADPVEWSVEDAGTLGVRENVDGVVGVGGGSSLDTAKAAALLLTNPLPISQYYGRAGAISKPSKPLIIIPTTAGTGSESTPRCSITDSKQGLKTFIQGDGCKVTLGIVDPELTIGLPPAITAATGMDALCHAAEAYTSALSNSFCDLISREAIRLAGQYLVKTFEDGENLEAREGMMLAATLGGMSMSGPLSHLTHDIGRVIGVKFHITHGIACAACLPQVLDVVAHAVPERVRYISESFGAHIPDDAPSELIGAIARVTMQDLLKALKLPNMRDLGLNIKDLLLVVPDNVADVQQQAAKRFGRGTCPVLVTKELVASIVTKAFDEN